ncbi:response regulator [Lysinibacillus parviboronicapiens]|uniref:response regulator n=1 Tax=Lysinibacillus parviboronicapiens TaxID=436516 RepID=UPI000D3C91B4|nr:response regulator [Lysinibacillus parviboronicapiens]
MRRIIILDVDSTRGDEIVSSLIGTKWDVKSTLTDKVVISACGGLVLDKGEYEYTDIA